MDETSMSQPNLKRISNISSLCDYVSDYHHENDRMEYFKAMRVCFYATWGQKGIWKALMGHTIDLYTLGKRKGVSRRDNYIRYHEKILEMLEERAGDGDVVSLQDLADIKIWITQQEGIREIDDLSKMETALLFIKSGGNLETELVKVANVIAVLNGDHSENEADVSIGILYVGMKLAEEKWYLGDSPYFDDDERSNTSYSIDADDYHWASTDHVLQSSRVPTSAFGWISVGAALLSYVIARCRSRHYQSGLHISTGVTISLSLLLFVMAKRSRAIVSGVDRTFYQASIVGWTVLMVMLIFFFESSCMHCAFSIAQNGSYGMDIVDAFDFFLIQAGTSEHTALACQTCTSRVFSLVSLFMAMRNGPSAMGDSRMAHPITAQDMENVTDIVSLASFMEEHNDQRKQSDLKAFQQTFLYEVAQKGHLNLSETLKPFLCSPTSRITGDSPVEFLEKIQSPRFSGESINLTVAEMSSIMRGDILKDLGVAACFVLRFALLIPDDPTIENIKIDSWSPPIMTEAAMRTLDATMDIPGVIIPQIDPDKDKQGVAIKLTKSLMDAYTKFPFMNDPLYFNKKDEYYFFYRWNLENSVQDPWYFPNWLLKTDRTRSKMIEVMSKKSTISTDIMTIQETTTDSTLSDRVFHGTGQKYLTPIKLPGVDVDYELMFPHKAGNFISKEHEDFFRCHQKPKREHLERMVKSFYLSTTERFTIDLEDWKDQIVEVDFAIVASIPSREQFYSPGVILYLDVNSRRPIGIWESSRMQTFLPSDGRDWEHAKFLYRVCERAILAVDHVIGSHFGRSQAVATASLQTLPSDHGLRALLKPFIVGVQLVNSAAYQMLVRDHSVLTHASGFTSEGVVASFMTVQQGFNYSESIAESFKKTKLDEVMDTSDLPLHNQGVRLYKAHKRWISKFLKVLYPTDEELLADEAVVRFWSHVDTYGRHLDPCVCSMPSSINFEDDTQWPGFESSRTCKGLMDRKRFQTGQEFGHRRMSWCTSQTAYVRLKALREWIESDCEQSATCDKLMYSFYHMRDNMGMGRLEKRSQLIDFLASFIWDVSAGHSFNSDNVPYIADPEYSAVRMRKHDGNGNLPTQTDIGTYVYAIAISALTTVRSPPLMADWSHIYRDYAFGRPDIEASKKMELSKKLKEIHLEYKLELLNLASAFLDEAAYQGGNRATHVFNPMVQSSSASA